MGRTYGQTSQDVNDSALKQLGTPTRTSTSTIFDKINTELDAPLRMSASFPTANSKLNFSSSTISNADGGKSVVAPVKKQVFGSLTAISIDFQDQSIVGSSFVDITWPTSNTVGKFRRIGFTLVSSGKIKVLFSAEAIDVASLANAGTLFIVGGTPIGYIDVVCTDTNGYFKSANSVTDIIENADIYRFGSGAGGGSATASSSGGGELADLMYSAKIFDTFNNELDGSTPTDTTSGKTDTAIYDSSNELVRLSYDASKTVTGVGTAMTLSSAPSFTIKDGDVLIVNGEVRKFTVTNQTTIVLESAFSSDPTASACCVSQAVHTVDLNNFTNNGLGLAVSSQFSGDIDEVMLGYEDSETLGDIIPNFGSSALVGFSASTDANNWTTIRTRVSSLSGSEVAVTCPTSNPNLYLRFFANKTSGSGAVNLLSYKVFFHKILGQVAGSQYYTAFARPTSSVAQNCSIGLVGGKTRFTFTFPYTRGLNDGEASGSVLEVIANGQIIPRYVAGVTDTTQAYFTEINDNTIEMDTDYSSAGIDFQFKVQRVGIIDNNSQNTSKISLHDDLLDQTLEAQVIPLFRSAVNGAPSSTQFRSDITNRASIPDLSSMLSVQMGPQRMMTQEIYQLQNEFGPNGQTVFGAVNDKFNQIRFVGSWSSTNSSSGQYATSGIVNDYVEIVFYGTGLNLVGYIDNGNTSVLASIDGGSEGSNILVNSVSANILNGRSYSNNIVRTITSGLSLGFHTVKLRISAVNGYAFNVYGFETLTETTSLRVLPGNIAKGKYKNTLSSLQSIAYDSNFESGALGSKGGCVLVYLKNDGTIGKSVTPTDATALYLTNTNHSNEEVIRTHHFREFGAGRTDDFSLFTALGNYAFTLDDGTTTLVGSNIAKAASSDGVRINNTGGATYFLTLTFIGTGLDIVACSDTASTTTNYSLVVDGTSQGSIAPTFAVANTEFKKISLCSGLPYGTHTVKIAQSASSAAPLSITQFIVYAPKKPSLPVGSIELAQYYKVADYLMTSLEGPNSVSTGVIRKQNTREMSYVGTWTAGLDAPNIGSGFSIASTVANSYVECTFFGTGFDYKVNSEASQTQTLSLNGSTNFSSLTTQFLGVGATWTPASGTITGNAGPGGVLSVRGLPLAKHTIRVTLTATSGGGLYAESFDIHSPIHAPTLNGPYVVQNTLSLGGNGFLDLRKFNKKDIQMPTSQVSQAVGLSSTSTSSTTPIPCANMSITHLSKTGRIRVSYAISTTNSGGNFDQFTRISLNGSVVGTRRAHNQQNAGLANDKSDSFCLNVPFGQNKIDLNMWTNGGTMSALSDRILTVEDIGAN